MTNHLRTADGGAPLGFPRGEAKDNSRKLVPFTEPRSSIRLRADTIRPYGWRVQDGF